jgi:hypothetical protein
MNLETALEENWPPSRVIAECGECGGELFDSKKEKPAMYGPSYYSSLITTLARSHRQKSGHNDLQVNINSTTPVREINATITVNP